MGHIVYPFLITDYQTDNPAWVDSKTTLYIQIKQGITNFEIVFRRKPKNPI